MSFSTIGKSVKGSNHKLSNSACQDSCRIHTYCNNELVIAAVADGHGSSKCKNSKTGAEKAVNAFFDVFEDCVSQFNNDYDGFHKYINENKSDVIPKLVCNLWNSKIENFHKDKYSNELFDRILYGTTLIGLIVCPIFYFAFQIGDGDLLKVGNDGITSSAIEPKKILGTETYSLSLAEAWKHSRTELKYFQSSAEIPALFQISTDGMSNSYVSEEAFLQCGKDYLTLLQEHGVVLVEKNLKAWLTETTINGCGDDIALVLVINEDAITNKLPIHKESTDE